MVGFSWEQRMALASFFSNLAVLFFGAAMISPVISGVYSVINLTANLANGIVLLWLSLKLIEERI